MSSVTIYGKPKCQRCELAKRLIPEAEYSNHDALWDRYSTDDANDIITASGGELPIIIIESAAGRLVLGASKATKEATCEEGACRI